MRGMNYLRAFLALQNTPLTPIACPLCGHQASAAFLTRDRYLLPIHFTHCTQCGMVYSSRNLSGEALQRFYRDHYRFFYEDITHITPHYLFTHKHKLNASYRWQRIAEVVSSFDSVLEIGSGLGFFLDECRAHGIPQMQGCEPGDTARNYAATTLQLAPYLHAGPYETLPSLPFRPQLVALFHVFEHVEHPADCLQWIAHRIHPEGTLVIEVPDITGDWSALGLAQFHLAHRWYFSPHTLAQLLSLHGFEPFFVTRDDGDGIYPGNLRMFARRTQTPIAPPLSPKPRENLEAMLKTRLALGSLRHGFPRAALRLLRRLL